jgi:hypothetical protein
MPDNIKQYYDYLKGTGKVEVAPNVESFQKTMSNPDVAQKYYNYLRDKKVDVAPSFYSFQKTLGLVGGEKEKPKKQEVEQPKIKEEKQDGSWLNVGQNFVDSFSSAILKGAANVSTWIRDNVRSTEGLEEDYAGIYDKTGKPTKAASMSTYLSDPLGRFIIDANNVGEAFDKKKEWIDQLPKTFWGNAVAGASNIAPDIASMALLPEGELEIAGPKVIAKIGKMLINPTSAYFTAKGYLSGYGEARKAGKSEKESTISGYKQAGKGFKEGVEMHVLGAGSNLATKSIMKYAESKGLTGLAGLATKELVNLGTDVAAFGLVSPTANAALEGRLPTAKEIADGTGIAIMMRGLGSLSSIKSYKESKDLYQNLLEFKQGIAISNFVDAHPRAIEAAHGAKESANELQVLALDYANKARQTTDEVTKRQHMAQAMGYAKAANIKQVMDLIIGNKDNFEAIRNGDLPAEMKKQFLDKAIAMRKALDHKELGKYDLSAKISNNDAEIKNHQDKIQNGDPIEKTESAFEIDRLSKENEEHYKNLSELVAKQREGKKFDTQEQIEASRKEELADIDNQIQALSPESVNYDAQIERLDKMKQEVNEYHDMLLPVEEVKPETKYEPTEEEISRQENYKLADLSDNVQQAKKEIAYSSDTQQAIDKYNEAKKAYDDFNTSIEQRKNNIRRKKNIELLVDDAKDDYENASREYEYKDLYEKDPRLAALQQSKDMLDFITSEEYIPILMKEGSTEQEAIDQVKRSSKSYNADIKDLETDLKENPKLEKYTQTEKGKIADQQAKDLGFDGVAHAINAVNNALGTKHEFFEDIKPEEFQQTIDIRNHNQSLEETVKDTEYEDKTRGTEDSGKPAEGATGEISGESEEQTDAVKQALSDPIYSEWRDANKSELDKRYESERREYLDESKEQFYLREYCK